jgi:hypothetical protein
MLRNAFTNTMLVVLPLYIVFVLICGIASLLHH